MPNLKTRRLSFIIGAYLFGATMVFSLGLLAWTYQSSIQAMDREVAASFEQSYAIGRAVLEHRGDLLGVALNRIAGNKRIQARTYTRLGQNDLLPADVLTGGTDSRLDILLLVLPDNTILADAGSPFFDLAPFYDDIALEQHTLLTNSRILTFEKGDRSISVLLKSVPLVHDYTGKVMGTLVGGIVLNDNYSLLESIRTRVHASSVLLLGPDGLTASTDLKDNEITQTVLSAEADNAERPYTYEPDIMHLPGNMIALAMPLEFHQRKTGLTLVFAVPDRPFAQLRKSFMIKAGAIFAAAVIFFLLTILLIRRLTMPALASLLTYSETVRTGEADTRFRPGPILEFNRLGAATEAMVAELNRSRRYVDDILNSMPALLIGVDGNNIVTHWNTRAAESGGISAEKAKGAPLAEVFPRLDKRRELIAEALRHNEPRTATKIPVHEKGGLRYENVTVYPLSDNTGAVILVEDVTDRTRIDDIMVQTEKMMSVGGLAAGMAHEINNPLGIIMQGAQGIERRMDSSIKGNIQAAEELRLDLKNMREYMGRRGVLQYVRGIREAGERAAEIVRNMLEFSRRSESRMAPCDINRVLDKSLELAAADYDLKIDYDFKRIEINRNYTLDLPMIPITQTEVEQVLLNIVKNAAQAMSGKKYTDSGPTLDIRTGVENNMVRVDIADNGPGMDDSVRKRIFEPFFTTKPVGTGTGLGLSVSYFIITQNHSGEFLVRSAPGKGTTFSVLLPVNR